jgi:hypothetical protein
MAKHAVLTTVMEVGNALKIVMHEGDPVGETVGGGHFICRR